MVVLHIISPKLAVPDPFLSDDALDNEDRGTENQHDKSDLI